MLARTGLGYEVYALPRWSGSPRPRRDLRRRAFALMTSFVVGSVARRVRAKAVGPDPRDRRPRSWRRRSRRPRRGEFPAAAYQLLGRSGLLSLPFAEEYGGGGQPYEVYLQVVEEIAAAWPSVGVGTSVHSLTATVVAANGTDEQREWLPRMLGGDWLGAYCLSEPQAGSDVSAIRTAAVRDGDEYVVTGTKQWISNGSCADYYILFARTAATPSAGCRRSSCPTAPRA